MIPPPGSSHPTVQLASITRRRDLFGSNGVNLIWDNIVFRTVSYSLSISSFHMNFPLEAVSFLIRGISKLTVGFHFAKEESIPEKIWQSFLCCGFLSSANACILLDLGAMNISSSFLTFSTVKIDPPNSNSDLIKNFFFFSFRFLVSANLRNFQLLEVPPIQ